MTPCSISFRASTTRARIWLAGIALRSIGHRRTGRNRDRTASRGRATPTLTRNAGQERVPLRDRRPGRSSVYKLGALFPVAVAFRSLHDLEPVERNRREGTSMRQFIRKLADHKPVNGFDYVREAVRENPSMTPEDIRSRRFGRQLLGGLNPEQVSAFLEDVADAFETVQRVSAKTETYMRMLQDELETVGARRATLLPRDAFEADEPRATSIIPDGEQQDEAAASRIEMLRST